MSWLSENQDIVLPALIGYGLGGPMGGAAGAYLGYSGREDRAYQEQQLEKIIALQREFAQSGIQWRVEDAKAAGINPLAALGASGASFSPVMAVGDQNTSNARSLMDLMGQNLSRAVGATMSPKERLIKEKSEEVYLNKLSLENDLINFQRTNIGKNFNPPIPDLSGFSNTGIEGQQSISPMSEIPVGRSSSTAGRPDKAFGSVTDWYYRNLPGGRLKIAPGPDVQGILANNAPEMLKWEWGHYLDQNMHPEWYTPDYKEHPLPKNKYWKFNRWRGTWDPEDWPDNWNPKMRRYYNGGMVFDDRIYRK